MRANTHNKTSKRLQANPKFLHEDFERIIKYQEKLCLDDYEQLPTVRNIYINVYHMQS